MHTRNENAIDHRKIANVYVYVRTATRLIPHHIHHKWRSVRVELTRLLQFAILGYSQISPVMVANATTAGDRYDRRSSHGLSE